MTTAAAWFDEINLDPAAHPVAMGTRSLGDSPWLIVDGKRDAELAQKRELLEENRAAVLHLTPECHEAATDVLDLVHDAGLDDPTGNEQPHPLVAAACTAQEDLALLKRHDDGWHLNSAVLCFPTRWTLADKIGRHIAAVHGPVADYEPRIAQRVDRLFDRLTERPVWRRNWFLMTNAELFQPFPTPIDHLLASEIEAGMWIRSERQTLRLLPSGWILFTIRVQQEPFRDVVDDGERREAFTSWVRDVPVETSPQRHLFASQRAPLLEALEHRSETGTWPAPAT